MTVVTRAAMRPFYARSTIERLAQLARVLVWLEKAAAGIMVLAIVVVAGQLLYPSGWTLPLQRIGGRSVGFQTTADLAKSLAPLNQTMVTVQVGAKPFTVPLAQVGASLDVSALSRQLHGYSWKQRLLPGSLLRQVQPEKLPTITKQSQVAVTAHTIALKVAVAPKDASISRQADGSYAMQPQVTGEQVDEKVLAAALKTLDPVVRTTVKVPIIPQTPSVTNAMLTSAIKRYDATRSAAFTFSYGGRSYPIAPDLITSWTSITTDQAQKKVTVVYDQAAIRRWLAGSVPLVLQKPGISTVTIVNGAVQSRSGAAAGSGIDLDGSVKAIIAALSVQQTSAAAAVKTLNPLEQYVRQYTPDNAGLSALIGDWAKSYPGLKAGVALREIGGSHRQASYNGGTQFATASIYKLYVDWYILKQAEAGKVDIKAASGVGGKSILQCIEASIVTSDNPCGSGLGNKFGWNTITNAATAVGYAATNLSRRVSTANDTANLLTNLATGSLLNTTNTQTLLGYMQRQIYRSGIPAGSHGAVVQDKVGFLPGIWNDAALVHTPHSTYVLVIYTNGNVKAISDLASRIYGLMQ